MLYRCNSTLAVVALAIFLAAAATHSWAQVGRDQSIQKSPIVDQVQGGEIDWGDGYIYASGEGVIPSRDEELSPAKAYLKAKNYGKMKAIANLLMAVEGTTICYTAVGKDYIAQDETLLQTIKGYISNVEVVREEQVSHGSDTIVVVTVRTPMYGPKGVGTAILSSNNANVSLGDPVTVDTTTALPASTGIDELKGPFTSLIIDCSGLNIERAMSPKIRRTDGSEVWGTVSVDYDFLQDHGIVVYATNTAIAKNNPRAGNNPLVVKAIGVAGGRFMCDAVISDADADRILRENSNSKFLDQFNVIFVVD